MNLPLLYWASEMTGDGKYRDVAVKHTATCLKNSFRPDGSTYHTFFMHKDGSPHRGETCQGYRADSFWAHGQAWAVYGSILSKRYTQDSAAMDAFRKALDFYRTRLPEDLVPCWDMLFQPESGEPRDSSSAAIVASGGVAAHPSHRRRRPLYAASLGHDEQSGAELRRAPAGRRRAASPRDLLQKVPLQYLYPGGRGRVRFLGRLFLHGGPHPDDRRLGPLLVRRYGYGPEPVF